MADYRFTQESGTAFKVSTADKTDALEDTNEVRQIITDIGALLGHSKKDGSYPADATSGGDIDIRRVTTKSAVATLTISEAGFVKVSAAAGYSLTLPTAVGNKLTYIFVKTDANTNLITIDGAGTETINGSLTYTDLNYQYAYVAIRSDNANWFVLFRSTNNIAVTTGKLSQFAATTSAELAGVISNETGTDKLVYNTSPTLITPILGVATGTSLNGACIKAGILGDVPNNETKTITVTIPAGTLAGEVSFGMTSNTTGQTGSLKLMVTGINGGTGQYKTVTEIVRNSGAVIVISAITKTVTTVTFTVQSDAGGTVSISYYCLGVGNYTVTIA